MKKTRYLQFIFIIGLITLIVSSQPTQAAVGLVSFTADLQADDSVVLAWETGSEIGTQGFIIKRQDPGSNAFISLPDIGDTQITDDDGNPAGFVLPEGGTAAGATYSEVDNTLTNTGTYLYKLFEIDDSNNEVELSLRIVNLLGDEDPTPTHTPTSTSTPTSTPTAGSIIAPTAPPEDTPDASTNPTDVPQATDTSVPTDVPTVTNTSIPTVSNGGNNDAGTVTATFTPRPATSTPTVVTSSATNTPEVVNASATNTPEADNNDEVIEDEPIQPPTSTPDNSNVVIAQENSTATPDLSTTQQTDATPTIISREDGELPIENPIDNTDPITPENESGVSVIGGENNQEVGSTSNGLERVDTSEEATTGRIWLWAGFIIGLLAFVGFGIGAIVIFTRQK